MAGGCFWCTESDLEQLPGVLGVVSGYSGGDLAPTYRQVSSGKSGHIEVIEVKYDPAVVNYEQVLDYFFRHIDPTDAKGSFVDRGPQYRPAIFYHNRAKTGCRAVDDGHRQGNDLSKTVENRTDRV